MKYKHAFTFPIVLLVICSMILSACAPAATQGVASGPTWTPCPTPESGAEICPIDLPGTAGEAGITPPAAGMPPLNTGGWQRITPEGAPSGAAFSFELPEGWVAVEGQPQTWTPGGLVPENGKRLFGVRSTEQPTLTSLVELESAFLPAGGTLKNQESVQVLGDQAQKYTLEVSQDGKITSYETHVILPQQAGKSYDLFVSAPTAEELTSLQDVLNHALESLQ